MGVYGGIYDDTLVNYFLDSRDLCRFERLLVGNIELLILHYQTV